MVNRQDPLDRVFGALVSPARRAILAQLETRETATVSELAEPAAMKLPAIMKHLDVLEDAHLITRAKQGRAVFVRLAPEPMAEAMDWLRRYERFWSARLDRLVASAERAEARISKERTMTRLTLVRRIAARPAVVFDALTTPEGVARWWGPDDGPVLVAEVDARVGGRFRVRFRMRDGSEHESRGEFVEVVRPTRLAMTWRWVGREADGESRVEIDVRPTSAGTELVFTHSRLADEAARRDHEHGWNGSLDKLVAHLEGASR